MLPQITKMTPHKYNWLQIRYLHFAVVAISQQNTAETSPDQTTTDILVHLWFGSSQILPIKSHRSSANVR